jgi:hypothetical protein
MHIHIGLNLFAMACKTSASGNAPQLCVLLARPIRDSAFATFGGGVLEYLLERHPEHFGYAKPCLEGG